MFSIVFYKGPCKNCEKHNSTKQHKKKTLESIVFCSIRRMSANSEKRIFKLRKCVYYCILHMQMRFFSVAKTNSTKTCDVRFLLYFTYADAVFTSQKSARQHCNENVSKSLRLCMKVTFRCFKGRHLEAQMAESAETFM